MMFHSFNGKEGYRIAYFLQSIRGITIERHLLIDILKIENKLRTSPKWVSEYSKKDDIEWLAAVTERIQLEALKSIDRKLACKEGLEALRETRGKYLHDNEITNLALYIRYDRSELGSLTPNSQAPNCTLHSFNGQISLHTLLPPLIPTVVIAGSYT